MTRFALLCALCVMVLAYLTPALRAQAPILMFRAPGPNVDAAYGLPVSGCPDTDGDGRDDVLVGARWHYFYNDEGMLRTTGAVFVYSGHTGELRFELRPPGDPQGGEFGYSVCGIPDIDGDGLGEVIVGAPNLGSVYLFSGADGHHIDTITYGGALGVSVCASPDLDGDGVPDFIAGRANASFGGQAVVFSGATRAELYRVHPADAPWNVNFGKSVASIPDLDGDGVADFIVGADLFPWPDLQGAAGRAYVYSGASGQLIREVHPPFERGPFGSGFFGQGVAGVADLDGDGLGDYVVTSYFRTQCGIFYHFGRADVFSGCSGELLATLSSPLCESSQYGSSVAGLPDVDGDGFGDFVIGARGDTWPGFPYRSGVVYVYSGRTFQIIRVLLSLNPRGQVFSSGGFFGGSVAGIAHGFGGRPGVLVSAYNECAPCEPGAIRGIVYLFQTCPADFNFDGVVNSQDFFDYLRAFFAGLAAADYDRDGRVTGGDFFAFLGAFFEGCEEQ